MPTYYVRKTGDNGNTGLSPAQAWLTIDNAANTVAAGDIVYVGSGVYRELVTMDTPGAAGNLIQYIADITGAYTGDAGPVIISGHTTDTAAAVRAWCVDMNAMEFITWTGFIFNGGSTAAVGNTSSAANLAYEGCAFYDCCFLAGEATADLAVLIDFNQGATPATLGLQLQRCVFVGGITILHNTNAVAHLPVKVDIDNCLIIGHYAGANSGVYLDGTGTDNYTIGDVDVRNCVFIGTNYACHGDILKDTANQFRVTNCLAIGCTYLAYETGSTNNAVYEDYNHVWGCTGLIAADVQQGGNSDATLSGPLLGGIADLMFYKTLGWSPWKPWEPMSLLDASYLEPQIGAADPASALTTDVHGNPRPMGRSGTRDIGVAEARARGGRETTVTYDASPSALRFDGAGYHDILFPVDAVLTTVTVYARYDANYAGSLPLLAVLNIPGVADQQAMMTAAVNTWEQLSVGFTPTAAGVARIRLQSRDTSANGLCYFDQLEVA